MVGRGLAGLFRQTRRHRGVRCRACGGGDHAHDALVPHGIEPTGHVWLHSRCWPAWYAAEALKAMGIAPPPKFPDDFGKNGGA